MRWFLLSALAGVIGLGVLWWQLTADRCPKLMMTHAEIASSPGLSRSELLAVHAAADARYQCLTKAAEQMSLLELLGELVPRRPGDDGIEQYKGALLAKLAAEHRLGGAGPDAAKQEQKAAPAP
jgi:hypothetical protein